MPVNTADYTIELWGVEQGLPQISVTSIAQTPDGYLWLATFNGLARFDGVRFTVFDEGNTPALGSSRIIRLEVDTQGALWIVTETGGLVRMAAGQFTAYGRENGLPDAGAKLLVRDAAGGLLLVDRAEALHRIENGLLLSLGRGDRLQAEEEPSLLFESGGPVWIGHRGKATRSFGQSLPVLNGSGSSTTRTDLFIDCAAPSRSGGHWLATTTGVYRLKDGRLQARLAPIPEGLPRLELMAEDGQGNCWAGTWGFALFRWDPRGRWQRFSGGTELADKHLNVLLRDREGNLWLGTGQGGLHRIKPRLIRMYDMEDGLAGNVVSSLAEDRRGRMWIGVNGGGLHRWEAGRMAPVTEPAVLRQYPLVYSVLADREDAVWVGLYGRTALRLQDGAVTKHLLAEDGLRATPWVLFEARSGGVWLGTEHGLLRYQDGRFSRYTRQEGMSHDEVHALAEDRAGALYIGTSGGGLNCLREGKFTCFTERQGLADDHISALYVDGEDTVWIGTVNGGLSRFKGGCFVNVTVEDGLPSNTIGLLVEDDLGFLWLGSNRGLIRISRRELNEYAEGRRRALPLDIFTQSDGLSTVACSGSGQPACWKARDGKLWFATTKGVAIVDPNRIPFNPLPPPVVIEELALDDRWYELQGPKPGRRGAQSPEATPFDLPDRPLDALGRRESSRRAPHAARPSHPWLLTTRHSSLLAVPAGIHRVGFRFTGLSLVAPEKVRFRYRLEGFDDDWIAAGSRRTADYARIPPGQFRFHVMACNNDGVWNETGAALDLVVLPPWWLTWWFRTLAFAGTAGGIFWWVEARVRRVKREHAAQRALSRRLIETQEAERKRIAAELHDSLGQDLLVIKNRAVLGLQAAAAAPQSAEQFGEISRVASASLAEVRQISHDLRPYQLDRLGLTKALRAMVTGVAAASGLRWIAEVDSLDGLLAAPMEIHCYRIVQELLNNVLKHSHASEARISAKLRDRTIRLVVEDDGCGFELVAAREGTSGVGLVDIAERVRILEGTLRCDSQRAKGTRWTIEIPVNAKSSS